MAVNIRLEEEQHKGEIKKIFDDHLTFLMAYADTQINLSTFEEDVNESFDMKYNININFDVAVRIRNNKALDYTDITIRSKTKYNNLTEIDKIKGGKGQVYIYAWLDKGNTYIEEWIILTVDEIKRYVYENEDKLNQTINDDGTGFISIPLAKVDIIASHGDCVTRML